MIDYWTQLYAFNGCLNSFGEHRELSNKGCRFLLAVILKHGYEIVILPVEKLAEILRRTKQGIVGGNCKKYGLSASDVISRSL